MSDNYWADQRYQDTFYALHGHLPEQFVSDCSLCDLVPVREEVDAL